MPPVVRHQVEGLRELDAALQELTTATAANQGRKALRAGGEVLADRMIELVKRRTGALAESIGVGTRLTRRQRRASPKQADVEMHVGPNDPAAIQEEFGNSHQAPDPFARPAWDQTQGRVLKTITVELTANVDKAVQRARRKALKDAAKANAR